LTLSVIASEAKQSSLAVIVSEAFERRPGGAAGLLRFARNDGIRSSLSQFVQDNQK